MNDYKNIKILEALAKGIDPITGELLSDESPCNQPEVIRCLFLAADVLKRNINKGTETKRSKEWIEKKKSENIKNKLPKNAGLPWSSLEKEKLARNHGELTLEEMSKLHHRTEGAIKSELKRQGLIDEE